MKYLKFLVLALSVFLLTCERDDICAASTPTTPRLFIEFYDISEQENLKSVPRLTVYGEGLVTDENGNPIEPEVSSSSTLVFNSNENNVQLPLRFPTEGEETTTRYIFEKDTNGRIDDSDTTNSNIDIVEITYTPQFEYVSRACGFKSIFTELTITVVPDDDNWILANDFPNTTDSSITVENENATHVQIFH